MQHTIKKMKQLQQLFLITYLAIKIILKFSQSNMSLKENCKYIFNKKGELQNNKNFEYLTQSHSSHCSQTQACSVLFQISNTEALQPSAKEVRYTQPKRNATYSPWKQSKPLQNQPTQTVQERIRKDYLSINKRVDLHKKQNRESSVKMLSQLIEFPINEESNKEKNIKRCTYFEKYKSKQSNTKSSQTQYTPTDIAPTRLTRLTKIESKSVQVLHLKRNDHCLGTGINQKSVIMLPNCKFVDTKFNLSKQNFKMSLIKKRFKNKVKNSIEGKDVCFKQNMNTTFENLLKYKLKSGILNIKQIQHQWKVKFGVNQQKIAQIIGLQSKLQKKIK